MRYHNIVCLILLSISTVFCETWRTLGPFGGWFSAIEISQSDFNVILVGTYYGGLYKSIDHGESWQYIGFKGDKIINSIAIDPNSPEQLFVSWRIPYPTYETGTARTIDGGSTWEELQIPSRTVATSSIISDLVFVGNNDGLFKSVDGGKNFEKVNYEFGFNNISEITSDPMDDKIIYLGTDNAIYKSTDRGENWEKLRNVYDFSTYSAYVNDISVSQLNNNIVLVGTSHKGVLISDDGGNSWIEKEFGLQVHTVFCDNQNEDVIYVGHLGGFEKSIDFGSTWQELKDARIKGGCFTDNTFFLLDEDTGTIIRSKDKGRTWRESNEGISNVHVLSLIVDAYSNFDVLSVIKAGTFLELVYHKDSAWNTIEMDNVGWRLFNNISKGKYYMLGGWNYFSMSSDHGLSWQRRSNGLPYSSPRDLAIHNDTLYLACATAFEGLDAGIYKSRDEGQNWFLASEGLPLVEIQHLGQSKLAPVNIYSIAMDENNKNRLYAGGYEDLFQTENYGKTWSKISSFQGKSIRQIIVDSDYSNTVYVLAGYGVYKSTDFGVTFVGLDSGMEKVNYLLFDKNTKMMYVAGKYGVYESDDRGETWNILGKGLENSSVTYLAKDLQNDQLFAGTYESGMFILDSISISVNFDKYQPFGYTLSQNHPNPFNPTTTIEFSIPTNALVTLTVYDILGREVETILNKRMDAGHYTVQWNASEVPTGVYFVRMVTGEFRQTRKLMVLR